MKPALFHHGQRSAIVLALAAAFQAQAQAQTQQDNPMQVVEIIGSTPLPGIGQARSEIAAPVQRATSLDMERSGALELGEFMNRRLGSVHVNEMQGNPFQMDVNYRGYTASPLLGTPQGLSVYLDGVRMNQPFGDVVSWDLIPRAAIASMTLMPGSNPLFGLSTLGAALSLHTKDGKSDPGTALQTTLGSNGRRAVEFEHGGYNTQGLNWYLTGNRFNEDGWRDASPSSVRQLFGKLGWQNRDTDLKLTLAHADNDLIGNGLQEQGLLARSRASVYTLPDQTQNRSTLLNLAASHAFNDAVQLSGNLYFRDINTRTLNGDINDDALSSNVYLPGENAANTPFPSASCSAQAMEKDEPAEVCNGLLNRTHSKQKNYGASGQLTWLGTLAGKPNRLVAGAGYDASDVNFTQSSQLGYLNPERSITGVNAFGDGITGGNVDGAPYDTRVDLSGKIKTWSVFASDTVALQPNLHLTLSGRYNRSTLDNRDQLHLDSDPATLSGDHRFARFNPAIGLSYSPVKMLDRNVNIYGGYNESSRAPTSIELGCANPEQPCKLPNAMAGDPPLNQVVTRTIEAGLRGAAAGVQWNAGVFRAENRDDILFVADNQAGFGYFKNFGKTRRQGLELGASARLGKLKLGTQYTLLDATYQSAETVNGSSNSSNSSGEPGQNGTIRIRAGDQIPLIPRQLLKLFADYAVTDNVMLSGGMVAVAGSLARGNENGGHQPDGKYYLGSGRNPGHAVLNLGASWHMTPQWQWQAQINNLFDTRYSTAAQLGAAGFDGSANFQAQPFGAGGALQHSTFYAPGAPRQIQLTLRYSFDSPGI